MKQARLNAKRWFDQAAYDLKLASTLLKRRVFSYACFFAEQSSEKALEAFLYSTGKRYIFEHSIQKLVQECAKVHKKFASIASHGQNLDKYYVTTRYPDAVPGSAVPFRSFSQKDGKDAVKSARIVIRLVKKPGKF